jgi:tetratricopeptide (TPR) repeat protein
MVELAGQTVTIIGRLATLPNRAAAAEIRRQGGTLRRALSPLTTLLVVGREAASHLADGRLPAKLARADEIGARCIGEAALLRALRLLPEAAPESGALRLDELSAKVSLDQDVVRLLLLFDVLQPVQGMLGFRDLVAAREVARLLRDGLGIGEIIRGAAEVGGRRASGDHPLARLKLVCDEHGHLARRIGDRFAELDGQMRLPLPDPGNPSADELFEAAEDAEQAGDLAAAEELYRRCTRLDRGDPIAPFNLANVLREQGRLGEAKSFFQLAIAVDPTFADAWYNLALLLDAEGQKALARAYLERASAADPDYADPLYNLAQLHFEARDLAEASRLWRRYLILDPDSEWSRRARHGLALCRRGNDQEAG